MASSATIVPQTARQQPPTREQQQALKSPCFVHSQLDNGASFADWLRASPDKIAGPHSPRIYMNGATGAASDSASSPDDEVFERDEDSDEAYGHASLTKQLADTAVGVREMSKQLGGCIVHSDLLQNSLVSQAAHAYTRISKASWSSRKQRTTD